MSSTTPTLAAGALVWRINSKKKLEVLLVHRPAYDDWSWPKGKVDPGESLAACAIREIAEETGVEVILGQPLSKVSYRNGGGRRKEAHYWAAVPAPEGDASLAARSAVTPASTREIDEVRWVEAGAAKKLLTYPHDREPLGMLIDQWRDERLKTWAMIVVRHARARKRTVWRGGESTRPLTGGGGVQARGLVPLLAAYGVTRVVSSPWQRCMDTVRPYADAIGTTIEEEPGITEDAHREKPKRARNLARDELKERAPAVAICTHRPVLPTFMDEVARSTPHRILKAVPERDPWLQTSEILVVHVGRRPGRGAVVVAIEKHRAPSHASAQPKVDALLS
ncbi:NUDIX hydrolase [Georgenia sp. MJ170]|uniref:NUDIX hydrolase n=1 Tax=Georgenia sunbinii TaxID=3117728 RepID=UPI002F2673E9